MSRVRLSRKTVTTRFRNLVKRSLPGLNDSISLWELTQYLMFPGKVDHEGRTIVDRDTLAAIFKYSNQRKFSATDILSNYKRRIVPNLEWSDYRYTGEQARVITHLEWPKKVQDALVKERRMLTGKIGPVYFATGEAVTEKSKEEHREYDRMLALDEMAMAHCYEAQQLLEYMNNLPAETFTIVTSNLDNAMKVAGKIKDETKRNRQYDILNSVFLQPQPYYKPTERTVRITSGNESVLRLTRDVRAEVTRGFIPVDLKNAQIAIAAKLWNIPSVEKMLQSGVKVWDYLQTELYTKGDKTQFKGIMKQAVYALVFGMSQTHICKGTKKFKGLDILLKDYGKTGKDFLRLPLIADILKARKNAFRQIYTNSGGTDAFGRFVPTSKDVKVNSVAAQIMQSYELYLMYPVVRAARLTQEFKIVLWLHDEAYIHFVDPRRKDHWLSLIMKYVKENADQLGMYTELEMK